jgi:putative aldouronate transport system substrate-binding protein
MVAPFRSRENLLLNYGVQDKDFTFDASGNPLLTQTGTAEVTTFPIWKMSAPPPVLFDPNDASFAAVASDATAKALQVGVASPVAGLFSNTAAQKSALLNQPLTDGLYNIMFGRDSVSALDGLVSQWRANGGDQIRSELQDALQKQG